MSLDEVRKSKLMKDLSDFGYAVLEGALFIDEDVLLAPPFDFDRIEMIGQRRALRLR